MNGSLLMTPEILDQKIGASSISECLDEAFPCVPDSEELVEIRYRRIHMGTFFMLKLLENVDVVAERIVEQHAVFKKN